MASWQAHRADLGASAEVAASALFEQHRARVYRFCLGRLGDREEAADAVQDTYAKAWLALRDGSEVRQPLAWLLTIAGNVCADRHRARRARPVEVTLHEDAAAAVPSLPRLELVDLPGALRALPDGQRRAFVLRELRGCSYEEICDDLDTSHASVAALLHRARRSVAATLGGAGKRALVVFPFPGVLRSAFEGGSASMTATAGAAAAATVAGAALLVAPVDRLPFAAAAPPAPPAAGSDRALVVPAAGVVQQPGIAFSTGVYPGRAAVASTDVAPVRRHIAPATGIALVVGSGGSSAGTELDVVVEGSVTAPAAASPEGGGTTAPAPETQPASVAPASPPPVPVPAPAGRSDAASGARAVSSSSGLPSQSGKSEGNGPPADPGSRSQAGGQSQGNGPPADPGSQSQASGQSLGNGPPADPGSQSQASGQSQGNGPPADPGSQSQAGGQMQGNGPPADPGSQSQASGQSRPERSEGLQHPQGRPDAQGDAPPAAS